MLSTAQLLSAAIGVLIPILLGLITRYAAATTRAYLQIVLNAANGFLVEWLNAITTSADWNFTQALMGTLLSLITSIAVQAGVWKPLGVSEWAKSSAVGSSDAPLRVAR